MRYQSGMKKLLALTVWSFICLMPVTSWGVDTTGALLEALVDEECSEPELRKIAGQGLKTPVVLSTPGKIILWDEAGDEARGAVSANISEGFSNSQGTKISIQGR